MANSFGAAGLSRAYLSLDNSNGILTGLLPATGGSAPAANSVIGMHQLLGGIDFNFAVPEAPEVTVRGDDKALFTFQFSATEKASGTLTTGVFDMDVAAGAIDHGQLTTPFDYVLVNPNLAVKRSGWMFVYANAQTGDSANFGSAGYEVQMYRVTFSPNYKSGSNFQAEGTYTWNVTAKPFSRLPWLEPLATGTHVSTSADGLVGFSDGYMVCDVWRVPGGDVSFDLNNTPVSILRVGHLDSTLTPYTILTENSPTPGIGEYANSGATVTLGDTFDAGDYVSVLYTIN